MNTYKSTFPNKHTFLAVIHVEEGTQALRNARIAKDEGADGIFLINHNISHISLLGCYAYIADRIGHFWIGLNYLDLGMYAVEVIPKDCPGLWIDNAGITEGENPVRLAKEFDQRRKNSMWYGIYFGGVAFKYQMSIANVAEVTRRAIPFVDVITTSGEGTGMAPDLSKVLLMKEAAGDHPLALASGVTPENVSKYMPCVDCFLVATGISDSHTELNPDRVRQLAKALGK